MAQLKTTKVNGSLTVTNLTANKIVTTSTDGLLTTFANGSANSLLMSDGTNASWVTPKIEGVSLKDGMLYYGLCTTAANTAAKVVTLTNTQTFTLTTGARVFIKFQNNNTVASPTLNVNSSGAKNIYAYDTVGNLNLIGWQANEIVEFVYDGNYWLRVGGSPNPYWRIPYTTCTTGAGTAAKTASLTNFVLETGAKVTVKFSETNTAANPTLNINSTGAKSIKLFGTTAIGTNAATSWKAEGIVSFIYDGTNWVMINAQETDLHASWLTLGANNELEIGAQISKTGDPTLITDSNYTTYFTQNQNGATYPWAYDSTGTYWACTGTQDIHNIAENTTMLSWTVKSDMFLAINWSVHSESVSYDWLRIYVNNVEKLKKGGNNQSGSIELKLRTNDIIQFVVRKDGSSNPTGEYYRVILNRYGVTSINCVNVNKLFINGNGTFGNAYKPFYLSGGVAATCSYPYATCTTAAGTAAKAVTLSNFVLETGSIVYVKFQNNNTAASPTLNVNSTGAKNIYAYGTTGNLNLISWQANEIVPFVYDGNGWLKISGLSNPYWRLPYTTCTIAAGTVAKTASLTDFVLETGAFVFVKFTYTNTATNPTLNINSTGAKQIMRYGTTPPGNVAGLSWYAGAVVGFVYDGTYWQMMNGANMLDAYIV